MNDPIDFYFDFSSPYGYLAAFEIEALAARCGRRTRWHPILLGAVFKVTGSGPLVDQHPMRARYAKRDMERAAERAGLPFVWPEPFPFAGITPSRAVYWADRTHPDQVVPLAQALYRASFQDGRNIAHASVTVEVAAALGLDGDALTAGMAQQETKDRLRSETDQAIALGVFGSPFFTVGDEPFWGHDRMPHLEWWLSRS